MRLQNWPAPGLTRRSRLAIGLLGATWRPITYLIPHNRAGIVAARTLIAGGLALASPPVRESTFDRIEQPTPDGPIVRGEWVQTPAVNRADAVVLYIHGSGYAICSSRTHRGLTSRIAHETRLPVFSVDYRLAPSHRYPAASQDVRAAWDWLLQQGFRAQDIVVAGDSAGGHLAVTLALELGRAGADLPAAIVALSPILDLSLRNAIPRDRIERDPFAAPLRARRILDSYADAIDRDDIGLQITFEGLTAFPPTLVHAGSREMLAPDCTELARRIRAAGFPVIHRVWPGQMHVFQAMTALMPESRQALAEVGHFISTHLPAAQAQPNLQAVSA